MKVLRGNSYYHRGGLLGLAESLVALEEPGGEDGDVRGIEDRFLEAFEEERRVRWKH